MVQILVSFCFCVQKEAVLAWTIKFTHLLAMSTAPSLILTRVHFLSEGQVFIGGQESVKRLITP